MPNAGFVALPCVLHADSGLNYRRLRSAGKRLTTVPPFAYNKPSYLQGRFAGHRPGRGRENEKHTRY
jgi:hypothetical protein